MPLPLFKNAYKVKGLEIRNENVGCLDKPVLFAISSGKVLGESFIFHLKSKIIEMDDESEDENDEDS